MKCSIEEMLERGERGWLQPERVQREKRQLIVVVFSYKCIFLSWSVLPSHIGFFSTQGGVSSAWAAVTRAGGSPALGFWGQWEKQGLEGSEMDF